MSLSAGGLKLVRRVARNAEIPVAELPVFLCPGILRCSRVSTSRFPLRHEATRQQHRRFHTTEPQKLDLEHPDQNGATQHMQHAQMPARSPEMELVEPQRKLARLPLQCAGCGGLSQTSFELEPGFYSLSRKSVKAYLEDPSETKGVGSAEEEDIVNAALNNASPELLQSLGLGQPSSSEFHDKGHKLEAPVCDRCHNLKHHETGLSIIHPTVLSLQQTISETPHKYNHIYHVIDAADFPMSLIPGIYKLLDLAPQRSQNRRSKTGRFYHGRKTEISFIITRSDLFAPLKEHVDAMMPYLIEVLRDALGKSGQDVRLGNVRCVSAIRGWWTPKLKEEIWGRGGGGWMVGKVNVGKSQLFQDVFPKGRGQKDKSGTLLSVQTVHRNEPHSVDSLRAALAKETRTAVDEELAALEEELDTDSLLPPARAETEFPEMPLVNALPGTTASPIRVPFGSGKGELIDLPGLSRGDLELLVQEGHRSSLVMQKRLKPEQESIKPGKSLLLGGFIRITPVTPDVVILAYAFTPIKAHLTSTEKAIGIQTETRETTVENIALPGVGGKIKSAGIFPLKWDVTRQRTGPLTRIDAGKVSVDKLPFRVFSTDILIEGVGWVELVAQVQKKTPFRRRLQELEAKAAAPILPSWDENPAAMELAKLPSDKGRASALHRNKLLSRNPEEKLTSWKVEPTPTQDKLSSWSAAPGPAQSQLPNWNDTSTPRQNKLPSWDNEPATRHPQAPPQRREARPEEAKEEADRDWPLVEVFTPEGKFVAQRRPMNAWLHVVNKPGGPVKGRPRRSMKGMKKLTKSRARASAAV